MGVGGFGWGCGALGRFSLGRFLLLSVCVGGAVCRGRGRVWQCWTFCVFWLNVVSVSVVRLFFMCVAVSSVFACVSLRIRWWGVRKMSFCRTGLFLHTS